MLGTGPRSVHHVEAHQLKEVVDLVNELVFVLALPYIDVVLARAQEVAVPLEEDLRVLGEQHSVLGVLQRVQPVLGGLHLVFVVQVVQPHQQGGDAQDHVIVIDLLVLVVVAFLAPQHQLLLFELDEVKQRPAEVLLDVPIGFVGQLLEVQLGQEPFLVELARRDPPAAFPSGLFYFLALAETALGLERLFTKRRAITHVVVIIKVVVKALHDG